MSAVTVPASDVDRLSRGIMRLMWLDSRRLAQTLAGYDLTIPQFFTLLAINRQGPTCRMGDLAHQMYQSSPTMTGIVTRLEADGLVERVMDPRDRRAVRVAVTERAKKMLDEVLAARREKVAQTLDHSMSPEDRQEFLRLLDRYLEALSTDCE
jgi:DNA-binding MarR family transcriptional regulator